MEAQPVNPESEAQPQSLLKEIPTNPKPQTVQGVLGFRCLGLGFRVAWCIGGDRREPSSLGKSTGRGWWLDLAPTTIKSSGIKV